MKRLASGYDRERLVRAFAAVGESLEALEGNASPKIVGGLDDVADLSGRSGTATGTKRMKVIPGDSCWMNRRYLMDDPTSRPPISVKFEPVGRVRTFLLDDLGPEQRVPSIGDQVVVKTPEGRALGTVTRTIPALVPKRPNRGRSPSSRAPRDARRRRGASQAPAAGQEAQRICLMKIRERSLPMKLARVEQLFDGSRLIFYFTADGRVDFRELVRELAAEFRTRIEMRQIGVRDEAKMLGGYGSCGRPLCCTTWLNAFEPISIKMAKQQNLSLNPSKLSGQCGRLKCCLRYELPNGKGVTHGGCAHGFEGVGGCARSGGGCGSGGCGSGRGCGSGGSGSCGGGGDRKLAMAIRRIAIEFLVYQVPNSPIPKFPRSPPCSLASASPSVTLPASARRSHAKAGGGSRVLACCEPVVYGPAATHWLDSSRAACPPMRAGRHTTLSSARPPTRCRASSPPSRRHRSTRRRLRSPGCRGAGTPSCSRTSTGARRVAMMFHSERLRVVLATIHLPLADVPARLTPGRSTRRSRLTAEALPRFGYPAPRLALAGLNPHAGEQGLLGREDQEVLAPAVERARKRGIDLSGPWPADTLFVRAAAGSSTP